MKTYEIIFEHLTREKRFITGEQLGEQVGLSRTAIWKAIQTLESKGVLVESIKNRGYRWLSGDILLPEKIAQETGLSVYYNPKSISTQLDAKQAIDSGLQSPALYLAPYQTGAKGRFGRQFFTQEQGGIYMSLHLQPNCSPQHLPPYTLMVASSIVKAICELTDLQPQIKWVNDIYLGQKKIAGILTEAITSIETGQVTDVIIGVGLNFYNIDFPVELQDKAGSLFSEQPHLTRNQLISCIWTIFDQTPKEELISLYQQKSLVLGKTIQFWQKENLISAKAISIDDAGKLTVQLEDGSYQELIGGDISLSSW